MAGRNRLWPSPWWHVGGGRQLALFRRMSVRHPPPPTTPVPTRAFLCLQHIHEMELIKGTPIKKMQVGDTGLK